MPLLQGAGQELNRAPNIEPEVTHILVLNATDLTVQLDANEGQGEEAAGTMEEEVWKIQRKRSKLSCTSSQRRWLSKPLSKSKGG